MENKTCPECGGAIRGRLDKKFCSDLCRHSFNNRNRISNNMYVRQINSILLRNRNILAEMIPLDSARVSKYKLTDKGFNFNYFTSLYTTKKGQTYFYCYEYGYMPVENGFYFLVRRKVD